MQLERKFYSQEVKRRFLTLNGLFWNKTDKSNQIKSNQIKSNQIKSNQIKSNYESKSWNEGRDNKYFLTET